MEIFKKSQVKKERQSLETIKQTKNELELNEEICLSSVESFLARLVSARRWFATERCFGIEWRSTEVDCWNALRQMLT